MITIAIIHHYAGVIRRFTGSFVRRVLEAAIALHTIVALAAHTVLADEL